MTKTEEVLTTTEAAPAAANEGDAAPAPAAVEEPAKEEAKAVRMPDCSKGALLLIVRRLRVRPRRRIARTFSSSSLLLSRRR